MRLLYLYLDFTKDGSRPEGDRGYRQCELNFGTRDVYTLERISAENPHFCLKQTKKPSGIESNRASGAMSGSIISRLLWAKTAWEKVHC